MKKILLLVLLSISTLSMYAQSLLITSNDTVTVTGIPSDFVISPELHYANNSGFTQNMKWVRTEEYLPNGWETTTCDKLACQGVGIASSTFTFYSNEPTPPFIKVNFAPSGIAGTGVVKMNLFSTSDSANFNNTSYFIATADPTSSVTSVQSIKDIFIYPTPVKENLYVLFNSQLIPNKIEVYNVLGQKVKTFPVLIERNNKRTELDLADLDKGLYFIRVYLTGSSAVITKQFTKE